MRMGFFFKDLFLYYVVIFVNLKIICNFFIFIYFGLGCRIGYSGLFCNLKCLYLFYGLDC